MAGVWGSNYFSGFSSHDEDIDSLSRREEEEEEEVAFVDDTCIVNSMHLLNQRDAPPLARLAYDRLVMCDEKADTHCILLKMLGVNNDSEKGIDKKTLQMAFNKFSLLVHPDKAHTPDILKPSASQLFAKARAIYEELLAERCGVVQITDDTVKPNPPHNVKGEFVFPNDGELPYVDIRWDDAETKEVMVTCLDAQTTGGAVFAKNTSEIVFSSAEYPSLFEDKHFARFCLVAVNAQGVGSVAVTRTISRLDRVTQIFSDFRNTRRNAKRSRCVSCEGATQCPKMPRW